EGSAEIMAPTLVSTLAICIVFVPIFLLTGTAKYLFSPLSLSVIISLAASLLLSFTLVPVLFKYLMRSQGAAHHQAQDHSGGREQRGGRINPLGWVHGHFERGFQRFREIHRNALSWA